MLSLNEKRKAFSQQNSFKKYYSLNFTQFTYQLIVETVKLNFIFNIELLTILTLTMFE
jgi:hypothetical protein